MYLLTISEGGRRVIANVLNFVVCALLWNPFPIIIEFLVSRTTIHASLLQTLGLRALKTKFLSCFEPLYCPSLDICWKSHKKFFIGPILSQNLLNVPVLVRDAHCSVACIDCAQSSSHLSQFLSTLVFFWNLTKEFGILQLCLRSFCQWF